MFRWIVISVIVVSTINFSVSVPVTSDSYGDSTANIGILLDILQAGYDYSKTHKEDLEFLPVFDMYPDSFNPSRCTTNYFNTTTENPTMMTSSTTDTTMVTNNSDNMMMMMNDTTMMMNNNDTMMNNNTTTDDNETIEVISFRKMMMIAKIGRFFETSSYVKELVDNLHIFIREKVCYDQDFVDNFHNYMNCFEESIAEYEESCFGPLTDINNTKDICMRILQTSYEQAKCLADKFDPKCGTNASKIIMDLYRVKPNATPDFIRMCGKVLGFIIMTTRK